MKFFSIFFVFLSFFSCSENEAIKQKSETAELLISFDNGQFDDVIEVLERNLSSDPENYADILLLVDSYLASADLDFFDTYEKITEIISEDKVKSSLIAVDKMTDLYSSEKIEATFASVAVTAAIRYNDDGALKTSLNLQEKDIVLHETLIRLFNLFFLLTQLIDIVEVIEYYFPEFETQVSVAINEMNFSELQNLTASEIENLIKNPGAILKPDLDGLETIASDVKSDFYESLLSFITLVKKIDNDLREFAIIPRFVSGPLSKTLLDFISDNSEMQIKVRGINYTLNWSDGLENGVVDFLKSIIDDSENVVTEVLNDLERLQLIVNDIKNFGSLSTFLENTSLDFYLDDMSTSEIKTKTQEALDKAKSTIENTEITADQKEQIDNAMTALQTTINSL